MRNSVNQAIYWAIDTGLQLYSYRSHQHPASASLTSTKCSAGVLEAHRSQQACDASLYAARHGVLDSERSRNPQ